jgi:hypothetical protein
MKFPVWKGTRYIGNTDHWVSAANETVSDGERWSGPGQKANRLVEMVPPADEQRPE